MDAGVNGSGQRLGHKSGSNLHLQTHFLPLAC